MDGFQYWISDNSGVGHGIFDSQDRGVVGGGTDMTGVNTYGSRGMWKFGKNGG